MKEFSFYTSKARSLGNSNCDLSKVFEQIVLREDVANQFYSQPNLENWCQRAEEMQCIAYSIVKDTSCKICLIPKLTLSFVGDECIPMMTLAVSELEFYAHQAIDYVFETATCGEQFARLVEKDVFKILFAQQKNLNEWKQKVEEFGRAFYIVNSGKSKIGFAKPRLYLTEIGRAKAPTIEIDAPYDLIRGYRQYIL